MNDVDTHVEIADQNDVISAISALSDTELIKVERFAHRRINLCGLSRVGYTGKDLLNQAILDTLDGTRTWKKNSINFYRHLAGVIRSISGHWYEKYVKNHISIESDCDDESELYSLEFITDSSHEKAISEEQLINYTCDILYDDELALKVIKLLYMGHKGPEIKKKINLNQSQYETIMKRMRRKIRNKKSEVFDEI